MAENYQTNIHEHQSRIRSWMLAITKGGGIDRYDELHLDRIETAWRDRQKWTSAGLLAFDLALNIRDQEHLPFSVVLGFSLKSGVQQKSVEFRSLADVENELSETPLSLYLFRPGQEPWTEIGCGRSNQGVSIRKVNPVVFGLPLRTKECFYFEFQSGGNEYSRSILLAG
jgi:hypothetical protein